jgi:hypothetical protein
VISPTQRPLIDSTQHSQETDIPASDWPQIHTLHQHWDQLCSQYMWVYTPRTLSQVTCSPLYGNDLPILQPVTGSTAEPLEDGYNINHSAADRGGAKDKRGRETEDDRFAVSMRPVSVAGCHETTSTWACRTRCALCSPLFYQNLFSSQRLHQNEEKGNFSLRGTVWSRTPTGLCPETVRYILGSQLQCSQYRCHLMSQCQQHKLCRVW